MKVLKRLLIGAGILAGLFCLNYWMNHQIFVRHMKIESASLPEEFHDFRIVQLTDIHSIRSQEQMEKILKKVRKEQPEIIVVTGDLVDSDYYTNSANVIAAETENKVTAEKEKEMEKSTAPTAEFEIAEAIPDIATLQLMEELLTIAPVYMVYGNHEMILLDDPENNPLKVAMEEAGVVLLNHEKVRLEKNGEFIWLTGVQDPIVLYKDPLFADSGNNNRERLAAELDYVLEDVKEEDYVVLLSHRPEYFEMYTEYPVDLALTGHAHGGQIRIPFIGGLYAPSQGWFPKYTSGLYEDGDFKMITSRGIGDSKKLMRVFNPPEIISVQLVTQ